MILIITLNPLLEYRFYTEEFKQGKTCRDVPCTLQAGGKGINVSRQLKMLGTVSYNLTFLGQFYGKKYRETLAGEGLEFLAVKTAHDTRFAHVLIENGQRKVTSFFTANSEVSKSESDDMKQRLDKMIQNCEIVVFSGSSPSEAANDIFPYGIELAHKYDKVSILDTYGAHLSACLDKAPTVIHNNVAELEQSLGISLDTDEQKMAFLNSLYIKGIKQAFLTDGENPFFVANHDFLYKVQSPAVECYDATGSGDAFTAGIVQGWYDDLVFDDMVRLAAALGAKNAAMEQVCAVSIEQAEFLKTQVQIEPVGKKMKVVDTRPTIYA
ncbi:MAG: 1-phosphofructokinase [Ignavibacteriales bacterium]|nr:1-phosphofructokinase [Ignavibacteriales bacterium]